MSIIDDATLLKMAEAELLSEAKKAAGRHSLIGVSGWQPCPKPNKFFLANTLLQTMASNRLLSGKQNKKAKKSNLKKNERKMLQQSNDSKKINFIYKKPAKKETVKSESYVLSSKFQKDSKHISKDKVKR